ncbi:MAG: aldehyde dehydrogenase [Methanospirillaceae archaeon]|nr:aldehyde dehydrogenase [Methanospirillaceae archaeon]
MVNLDMSCLFPPTIPNWIDGKEITNKKGRVIIKKNPANQEVLCNITASDYSDVSFAVTAAKSAQMSWALMPAVQRGNLLFSFASEMKRHREEIAHIVHLETGKSLKDARGETDGAILLAHFFAGEGQRLYGRTCTSGVGNKYAMTIRQPIGLAGLIVSANTPIANIAWKLFPALICGNAVILKAAQDAPITAWFMGKIAHDIGLPSGLFNIIQGHGREVGNEIVKHPDIDIISFTGSTSVGKEINIICAERLARVSLELGGKNPLVVCDDADQDNAVKWILLSAFSNAGQRCASASRIIIFDTIYEKVVEKLKEKTDKLKVGIFDTDDFGPVINEKQLQNMLNIVNRAKESGGRIITGGYRLSDVDHASGYYMAPTLIDNVHPNDEISLKEIFGPIACLYRVKDFAEALHLANNSQYGLTSCIHTKNVNRAIEFSQKIQSGVAVVNGGTYGSEPHMPFGGFKESGNGTREPGTEALDVYSELKDIYLFVDENQL